ncbi:helix-turn-helix transcriptional regulator [Changpingibacter yushuensis]|uniref:helix-turn-helix transcriptional regulator n=1 Tax=Changpingibacter yushuensis TaxID=2758440 RepID=UPI00165EA343|nr:helix-turn-helix domain-containing protein [Changpingibacter yushuensis]
MSDAQSANVHAALAVPARRELLDALESADQPLTAQQIAEAIGLHVTTARFHLDQLEQAGLVTREVHHESRRGRPGVRYRSTAIHTEQASDQMIGALAGMLAMGSTTNDGPLEAGLRWAENLPSPTSAPQEAIAAEFARMGFSPSITASAIELHSCPFRDAASLHPGIVCQVHLGLARGLAARAHNGNSVQVDLTPFAQPNLCLLTFQQLQAD